MKSLKETKMPQKPVLLDNQSQPKKYIVNLSVANGSVDITFTDRRMAQDEYNRIKAAGIYAGQWIKHIHFDEIPITDK